jgi:ABC-type transporter Mla subunit MlaD
MTIEELTALFNGRGRAIYEAHCHIVQLTDSLNAVTRERDEARAEVGMLEDRLSESRAEVERLTDERDELLVRVADQDAELRATREAYGAACRRVAEEP